MQFKKSIAGWMIVGMMLWSIPFFAQEQELADLENPDTLEVLTPKGGPVLALTDAQLKERLSYLNGCLELRTNPVVKSYVKTYVLVKTDKTRKMLGRRLTYFPLFEAKLKEYGLPADLKYLSVVESALEPKAVSRVGATGLWQFMPATGSDYGLRTNSAVEDRSNPVKSTDAAARYLRDLYKQFNDWSLALAAYNSGPNRVNSAIKRSGSRNFWVLQRFLPEETRNYVPAFIAASYICNYYHEHGLDATLPAMDEQLTAHLKVYEGISFRDISDATGVPYSAIKNLNPGFRRDYIPPSKDGHFVVIPERVLPAFIRYMNSIGSHTYALEGDYNSSGYGGDGNYYESTVKVQQAESLDYLGQRLGVTGDHLKEWNNLKSNYVYPGQVLRIWRPVYIHKHDKLKIQSPGSRTNAAAPGAVKPGSNGQPQGSSAITASQQPIIIRREEAAAPTYQYHTVKRNESLEDIARQYATNVDNLRRLNNLSAIKFGMRIKVRAN